MTTLKFDGLSDQALLTKAAELAHHERLATAELIVALAEIDERKLYLGQGCSSMFTFCTQALQLSEHAAYDRIEAARLGRKVPIVLDRLACGALTLTNLRLLGPFLQPETAGPLLDEAAHKSKHEVETIVARLRGATKAEGETYTLQITISGSTREKLLRAQELWRHAIPDGDIGRIFDRALTLLVERGERRKSGATRRPRRARASRSRSRYVSMHVRREVWARDGGRCAFVGPLGRCEERAFLEFHHRDPYAAGGPTTAENLELRCRAHNQYEATLFFGERRTAAPDASPVPPIDSAETAAGLPTAVAGSPGAASAPPDG